MARHQPPKEFVKELAEAIGRVTIAFAALDHAVTICIKQIFHLTLVQERSLVRPLGLRAKTSLLRRVGEVYLSRPDYKDLKETLRLIEDHADTRNDLAHGFYGANKRKFGLLTFSGNARLTGRVVPWDPTKLNAYVRELQDVTTLAQRMEHLFPKVLKRPKNPKPTQ